MRVFVGLGVRRVRLTGGEPTVRRDLPTLVRLLRALPGLDDIALSTNGHLLPELAAPLRAAGVDRLNVSLDSLDAERFQRITRRGELARVLAGIEAARAAGFASIKLNTVAIRGFNDDELAAIAAWAWRRGLVPRFIEQMPMASGLATVPGALLPAAEIRARVAAGWSGVRVVDDDGGAARGAGPARYFRLVSDDGDADDGGAPRRFGIISPMTEHFCDTCNRLRLSTTGALHTCLAYDDAVDLREPLHRGGPEAVRAHDPAGAGGETRGTHLRPHRHRRPAQGDGTNRRMTIDAARLKSRIADLAPEFEQRLGALCARASVSMDPGRHAEMDACATLAGDYLREAGARVDVIATGGFPIVLGRIIQDPSFPTVTVYNHLDVQPADARRRLGPGVAVRADAQG